MIDCLPYFVGQNYVQPHVKSKFFLLFVIAEIDEFKKYLSNYKVVNYVPPKVVLEKYMDGGVAIIDQWICAHAR